MCWSRALGRERATRRRRDERGSTTLELAVLFPVVLLIIFMAIQGALYFHARSVALSAAQEGLRVAKAENGSAGAGSGAAKGFVAQAGGDGVLRDLGVSAQRSATTASVTVTGQPLSVIPGVLNFSVKQTAEAPVERFTAPNGGP